MRTMIKILLSSVARQLPPCSSCSYDFGPNSPGGDHHHGDYDLDYGDGDHAGGDRHGDAELDLDYGDGDHDGDAAGDDDLDDGDHDGGDHGDAEDDLDDGDHDGDAVSMMFIMALCHYLNSIDSG